MFNALEKAEIIESLKTRIAMMETNLDNPESRKIGSEEQTIYWNDCIVRAKSALAKIRN